MKNLLLIISTVLLLISLGCKKSDSFPVNTIFYPNSFTPNGDGLNDRWGPRGAYFNYDTFSMKIFNKKDKLLYETDDFINLWDGKVNGEVCPIDYYYYVVTYETLDGVKYKDTGMFQLLP